MSTIKRDPKYPDLVWIDFDGHTWDEYNQTFSDIVAFAKSSSEPIIVAFDSEAQMPKGAPLPHLKRTASLIKNEDNIRHMFAISRQNNPINKIFVDIAAKLFLSKDVPITLVFTRDALYEAYHQFMAQKQL